MNNQSVLKRTMMAQNTKMTNTIPARAELIPAMNGRKNRDAMAASVKYAMPRNARR